MVALGPLLWTHESTSGLSANVASQSLTITPASPIESSSEDIVHNSEKSSTPSSRVGVSNGVHSESQQGRRLLFPIDIDAVDFRYLSHAVVDEDRKLLVCAIPKVASSEWKKLFLRMQGDPDWRAEPWWKMRNLTTLYKVGRRRAMEILVDPTWSKGVFFRDPLKRLLSCYLDTVPTNAFEL